MKNYDPNCKRCGGSGSIPQALYDPPEECDCWDTEGPPDICSATTHASRPTHQCELPHGHPGPHHCYVCGTEWPKGPKETADTKEKNKVVPDIPTATPVPEKRNPYGYCPICHAPGQRRERRINGDDTCYNGHTYPSAHVTPGNIEAYYRFKGTGASLSSFQMRPASGIGWRIRELEQENAALKDALRARMEQAAVEGSNDPCGLCGRYIGHSTSCPHHETERKVQQCR